MVQNLTKNVFLSSCHLYQINHLPLVILLKGYNPKVMIKKINSSIQIPKSIDHKLDISKKKSKILIAP